jgi:hypothetical protein
MQDNCRFIFMFASIKIRGRLSGVTQVQLTVSDQEADEMVQRVYKTLLKPAPDDARAQLEELALRHQPAEYAAGERLRAVAAELVRRGLEVTAVDYRDGSQELEVMLSPAGQVGSVTVDRDGTGQGCQLSWEEWVDIADEAGVRRAAGIVDAVLRSVAGPGR